MAVQVYGESDFRAQIEAGLRRWQSVDPESLDLIDSIKTIYEHSDNYKAFTLPNGDIYLSRRLAFWPKVGASLQLDILASYLAHESAHAYMLSLDNEHWNDKQGEAVATKYQELIAERLGIPMIYITYPERTVGVRGVISNDIEWAKLGALAAGALATVVVTSRAMSK